MSTWTAAVLLVRQICRMGSMGGVERLFGFLWWRQKKARTRLCQVEFPAQKWSPNAATDLNLRKSFIGTNNKRQWILWKFSGRSEQKVLLLRCLVWKGKVKTTHHRSEALQKRRRPHRQRNLQHAELSRYWTALHSLSNQSTCERLSITERGGREFR